jgi:hypothetical protein
MIKVIKKANKAGRDYLALVVDLGYAVKVLSFNPQDIAEICGVSVRELYQLLERENSLTVGEIKF